MKRESSRNHTRFKIVRSILQFVSLMAMAFVALWVVSLFFPQHFSIIALGGLIIISLTSILYSYVKSEIIEDYEISEYKRMKLQETHPVFYRRISKYVSIKNDKGDADIDYHMESRNSGEDSIQQLVHEIHHDGRLQNYNAYSDGRKVTPEYRRFILKELVNGEVLPSLARVLKIKFDFREDVISPKDNFSYGYVLTYSEIFKSMFEEDYTGQRIMHPTALLVMSLEAPRGNKFIEKRVEVVDKHEVADSREGKKCNELYPPKIIHGGKRMNWEVPEPKIACTYKLYFKVARK